ncbi:hypothetical protein FACS1894132_02420 [Clostridia bacterium]|nr:hypothetical protein FACS1894132_02420 [Clostridia bacterium]
MGTINTQKTGYCITYENKNFWLESYSCNIFQKMKIMDTLGVNFMVEKQGIPPFELIIKGFFEECTQMNPAALRNDMVGNNFNTLSIGGINYTNSSLIGFKYQENITKQLVEYELTFLVLGGVTQ